ncbi:hypothetical protein KUTeg_001151 [Tegillarca granosa]|uniref:Uncharacterized protein n=1 Tax=Tegillarca granosa TaxID=220873 RepID=A0ABQ9FVM1_TEGGR|nr:hypothetical protein KUTeg_001151 [Tegillarca granosa]
MRVNLLSLFWTVKAFLPDMMKQNHGHIVNIASSAGLAGISKLGDYSSSKFGVIGFTEVLQYEMKFSGYTGVHTTVVCPAMINTGMFQGARMRYIMFAIYFITAQSVINQGAETNNCQTDVKSAGVVNNANAYI